MFPDCVKYTHNELQSELEPALKKDSFVNVILGLYFANFYSILSLSRKDI